MESYRSKSKSSFYKHRILIMETRSLKKKNNFWYDKIVSVTNEIWATAQLWPQKLIMILTIVVQKISESNTYFRK